MKKRLVQLSILTLLFTACEKPKGCTDPDAENYDSKAKKDDGSCEYPCVGDCDNNHTLFDTITVSGKDIITIKDRGNGIGNISMDSANIYVLDGFVFVNAGQTLNVMEGTTIKGKSGLGENASALIVARDGMINACGTAAHPIVMTSETDNGTLPNNARGLWGGLIVLGNAQLNSAPGSSAIEGIPTVESRGLYGGTNDADNSGTLCYISIRHGGTDIGAGNEINGFTLGGVGSGTTINHIEVIANADDGIELFGGTAQMKNVVVSYCGDNGIDYDEGYRGKIQFALVYQEPAAGNETGQHDGGTSPEDGTPYAEPHLYNVTYIGRGISAGKRMITLRDNAGGHYHNSIFMNQAYGIDIEKLASGEDSYNRYQNGSLSLQNNVFFDIAVAGSGATAADVFEVTGGSASENAAFQTSFATWNNTIADPGIIYAPLNPIPSNTANVSGGVASTDAFFDNVTYQGSFDPTGANWADWTKLFQ